MADNRTMAELLQAPTEGYEDAIVIPKINANFELKHGLINLVQNKQFFFGHDKEDHISLSVYFNKITSTMRFPDIPSTSIKLMFFPFSLEDAIECLKIIESKSKVHNSRNKAVVAKVSSNSSTPGISPDVAALTTEVSELKNMMKTMLFIKQEPQAHRTDPVKAGQAELNQNDFQKSFNDSQKKQDDFQNMMLSFMQNYHNSNTASTSRSGALPGQTVTNPREHVNVITTRSGSESTTQSPPPEDQDSIFIEILKPRAKKTVIQEPNSYQLKLPYPERMKVREKDKPSTQQAEKLEEIAITTVNAECSAIILNKVPEKLKDPGKFLIPCALQELIRLML
ncbi:hypothetical protein Tco_0751725 [Tanacetum coccineum]|uniref:Reverse transcriptase domain-containing protein n=1 Tax=Tanacetum coccineum TaxID=301880 RepID=A0ABQ4Z4T7_9ASTR